MKKLLFVILIAVSFLSCSKKDDPVPTTGSLKIIFTNTDKNQSHDATTLLGLRTDDSGILRDIFYSNITRISANSTATLSIEDLLPGCYCFVSYAYVTKDKRNTVMIKPGKETVLELSN